MKLVCPCGAIIVDQTDDLPYRADIIPHQDWEPLWGELHRTLRALVAATVAGTREEWIRGTMGPGYPLHPSAEDVVSDLLGALRTELTRHAYQCEECGRLLVQDPADLRRFHSFAPEGDGSASLLASRRPRD
ncbi:hypothetical protein [Sandaracinus amylolyticus]|uniref:hypothetical protein n=1 Tax=Sandaracinus amylolyticus TaxID=927083 RepID=UPI00069FC189|nr:hypothetical protein [Sandaracinus amylolyticus]